MTKKTFAQSCPVQERRKSNFRGTTLVAAKADGRSTARITEGVRCGILGDTPFRALLPGDAAKDASPPCTVRQLSGEGELLQNVPFHA